MPGIRTRVQIYFLENQEYFGSRNSLYIDPITGKDYPDNDERFIILNRAVVELIIRLGWYPDVIHLNDWQCGLAPAYIKTAFKDTPGFDKLKHYLPFITLRIRELSRHQSLKRQACLRNLILKRKEFFIKAKLTL